MLPLALSAGEGLATPAESAHGGSIVAGPNVHVSGARANRGHAEVVLAADPADATRLLAGSIIAPHSPDMGVIAYASRDGGRTWRPVLERKGTKDLQFADPAVAYGPKGSAYLALVAAAPGGAHLEWHASGDGGQTWRAAVRRGHDPDFDRPYLAADRGSGRFRGSVYCNGLLRDGRTGYQPALYVSRDRGKTVGTPRLLSSANARGIITGNGVVLSDGSLVLPYWLMPRLPLGNRSFEIRVRRSSAGAVPFGAEKRVAKGSYIGGGYVMTPVLAADPGSPAYKDRLYLVWSQRTATGRQVRLTISRDRGARWSKPVLLSEQPAAAARTGRGGYDAVLPAVAVNAAGVVGVSWYDGREGRTGKPACAVRFRASWDGGKTWLPSVRVTDKASRLDLAAPGKNGWLGDTSGLDADAAGAFHLLWIDDRTGLRQVFTATVRVKKS